jgi:hypothetical protein
MEKVWTLKSRSQRVILKTFFYSRRFPGDDDEPFDFLSRQTNVEEGIEGVSMTSFS